MTPTTIHGGFDERSDKKGERKPLHVPLRRRELLAVTTIVGDKTAHCRRRLEAILISNYVAREERGKLWLMMTRWVNKKRQAQ
ncbi:hypothetical protein VNO77_02681 [Canavalia gladiata]|uniref:Uncharacterized protein n=1 Tax=Canavalia gladiata TaxID=3824 RepID=A0AAN9MU31_CANGL